MKLWRNTLEGISLAPGLDLGPPGDAERIHPPTREAARALVDRLARDPMHLDKLRAILGSRPGASGISARSDAEILDEIAAQIERGALHVEVSRVALTAPRPIEQEEKKPEQKADGKHDVEFEITDNFGDPVAAVKYTLTYPDGSTKEGTLGSDGRVKESGVPPGTYKLKLKILSNARWSASKVMVGEAVKLLASAPGFPAGTSGSFEVHDYRGLDGDKIADVSGKVSATGTLEGEWTPQKDDVKSLASGKVVFIAKIGDAAAMSPRVPILVKHEFELNGKDGALPDTTMIARFVSGYEAKAAVRGGKAAIWVRVGDRLSWIDLPDHAGSHMKVEEEGEEGRELYLPEAIGDGDV